MGVLQNVNCFRSKSVVCFLLLSAIIPVASSFYCKGKSILLQCFVVIREIRERERVCVYLRAVECVPDLRII